MVLTEHRLGKLSAIPCGEGRMIRRGPHLVAVFHLRGGEVRATEPWCPHRGGPLADGLLGDGRIVCPLHNRSYCLTTGEGDLADEPIATFPARVENDGTIVVTLPEHSEGRTGRFARATAQR